LIVLAALTFLGIATRTSADDIEAVREAVNTASAECVTRPVDTAIDSELGSVGFMKNIAEHPESIRAIAKRLLVKAIESPAFRDVPDCGPGCAAPASPSVIYKVDPTVFLPEAEQQAMCLSLEDETAAKPLRFEQRAFASLEQLHDWMMEFSQGRGDDGKQLYAQCGGNCSPRYTFRIQQDGDNLVINADVLCGLARDRKSDQYLVSTTVRWPCGSE
jgi:hypothetical protein